MLLTQEHIHKLKGAGVRHKKGYALSEKGAYALRQIEGKA